MAEVPTAGVEKAAPPFHIRPLNIATDVPALARLLEEIEAVDDSGEDTSEATLRELLAWPGHDPGRDRWVVEEPGRPDRLVAHALAWKPGDAPEADLYVGVHPDWRGRGLGRALLAHAVARARELGAVQLAAYGAARSPAVPALLARYGFAPVATWVRMYAPAAMPIAGPIWPPGYRVQTVDMLDDPAAVLAAAMTRGYLGQWGHHTVDEASQARRLTRPDTRADGIFVLFGPRGDVAGVCVAAIAAEGATRPGGRPTGYIDAPGVVAEHDSPDLRRALLCSAMTWLQANGQAGFELESWGDRPETLALYESAGFQVAHKQIAYGCRLAPGQN